jgi:hypothetical protein
MVKKGVETWLMLAELVGGALLLYTGGTIPVVVGLYLIGHNLLQFGGVI